MAASVIIGLIFIAAGYASIGKGLVLGALFSVINFAIMAETLPVRLKASKAKLTLKAASSILLRYFVLAIPLFIGIKYEQFNFFAVTAGIFVIQIAILSEHILGLITSPRHNGISNT